MGESSESQRCLSFEMKFHEGVRGAVLSVKEVMYCGAGVAGR